ncbi:hypothetical protein KSS87_014198 [Heliosperma pusillum]|nr:hypothetical protein KSS87_014198 [Heliosperma pusillum]
MDSCTLKLGASISMYNDTFIKPKSSHQLSNSSQFHDPNKHKEFIGQSLIISNNRSLQMCNNQSSPKFSIQAQASLCVSKALRWWDKTLKPNMVEIHSAQQFVDTLKNAGDKLVIVDFYSPGCGGCKSLHPKIKKFKDALAKHSTERCSLGPAKGLDESEIHKLASIGELSLNPSSTSTTSLIKEDALKEFDLGSIGIFNPLEKAGNNAMLVA